MWPKIFDIPGLGWPINSYGFSIMVGFLLASWIAVRRAKPLGLDSDFILDVGIIGMIFGIVGAKINYLLQYHEQFAKDAGRPLWDDPGLHPLGVMLGAVPFAFWFWRTQRSGEKVKLVTWQNAVLLVLTLVFAFVGARAWHLYQNRDEYSWRLFKNWQSGFVLYGGLITGIAAGALYIKMRGKSVSLVADLAAGPMMLALAFGRLGCFLNGCCYGKPGTGFPCVRFPAGSPAAADQQKFGEASNPVHPTQLYEAAAAVGFFFLLSWIWRKPRKLQGEVFLFMVMLYGSWRFIIEFARGDERPIWFAGLSYSQVVSLVAGIVAAAAYFLLRKRVAAPAPPAQPPAPAATPSA
jgi:phosphatidylglycerol:prolipoprotein diacylglycerol transferase